MDNKRKATSSAGAGGADVDDRASKRRRVPGPPSEYDLMKGETHESTTAYGLTFLEMIRRTKDKSGRTVADYFENLLPREGNEEYYRRVRMPISLKVIEKKLHNQDFANLAELEGFFKRMVMNAKEYYHKGSDIFEDAERVRKALSNYMTKTNPAYKLIPNYSCTATPIPAEPVIEEEQEAPPVRSRAQASEDVEEDDDAEGDEDEDAEGEEDEEEDEDDEDEHPRRIVLKRRGPGRANKDSESPAPRGGGRNTRAKADHEYEGVPYKGLNFQQAQEKIVEELIRKPDGSDPYFLDFINLPPRSYKDYFSVITSPLSLKGLQKLVKGIYGRKPATGMSEFKSWAAFEEKASLLWTNAHYYNEESSIVYQLATELKAFFEKELSEAKAVVAEPPQPKIKLKVPPGQETPVTGSKKITIHVGGSRSSAAASPAPPTGQSSDSNRTDGPAVNGGRGPQPPAALPPHLEKTRSGSGVSPSPTTSWVRPAFEDRGQPLPGGQTRVNGAGAGPVNGPNGSAPGAPLQNGHPQPPVAAPPPPPIYDRKLRAPGKGISDALITSILVRTHPTIPLERRFRLEIPAHPRFSQQNITVHLPPGHSRLQLIPRIAYLEQQHRQYRIFVAINSQFVGRATPLPIPDDPLPSNAMVFECGLQPGTNQIAVTMIAALPKGQKLPGGEDCELERVTINAYLPKP